MRLLVLAALGGCVPDLVPPVLADNPTHDFDGDGYSEHDADCDDEVANVNPGADERCDGIDNDCDTVVDGDAAIDRDTFYLDADGDGFGHDATRVRACTIPAGYVSNADDCDDEDAAANPGTVWYRDADRDGYGDPATSVAQCHAPNHYVSNADDCDDGDPHAHPGAIWYADADDDGFGDGAVTRAQCDRPEGYSDDPSDCDDTDAAVHPLTRWHADADADGWGEPASGPTQCAQPTGHVLRARDCDDADPLVNPDADEVCDPSDVDEDCDGLPDELDADATGTTQVYVDADGDGHGAKGTPGIPKCEWGPGYAESATDCDDGDATVHPGATETCDVGDEDCDGLVNDEDSDVAGTSTWYADADADKHGAGAAVQACAAPTGHVASGDDCDDSDGAVFPGAVEACGDDVDGDCDGIAPACLASGAVTLSEQIALFGPSAGARLGASLASLDPGLVVGAPGAGAVYLISSWPEASADIDGLASAALTGGPDGAGAVVAGRGGAVLVAGGGPAWWWTDLEGEHDFGSVTTIAGEAAIGAAAVGDLDGDGALDALVGVSGAVCALLDPAGDLDLADADACWSDPSVGGALAAGDLDGDGLDDALAGGANAAWALGGLTSGPVAEVALARLDAAGAGRVVALSGDLALVVGDAGIWGVPTPLSGTIDLASTPLQLTGSVDGIGPAGDVDGDGEADLIAWGPSGTSLVLRASWTGAADLAATARATSVAPSGGAADLGAPWSDWALTDPEAAPSGRESAGTVWLLPGGPAD